MKLDSCGADKVDAPPKEAWQIAWAASQPEIHALETNSAPEIAPAGSQGQHGTNSTAHALSTPAGTHEPSAQPTAPTLAVSSLSRSLQSYPWGLRVLRCGALDAGRLDGEIAAMVGEQIARAASLLPAGHVSALQPELNALLRLVLYGIPLWTAPSAATPGSRLLNFRYRSEAPQGPPAEGGAAVPYGGRTGVEGPPLSRRQRAMLVVGGVVLPYIWSRLGSYVSAKAAESGEGGWGQWHDDQGDAWWEPQGRWMEADAVEWEEEEEGSRGGVLGAALRMASRNGRVLARLLKALAAKLQTAVLGRAGSSGWQRAWSMMQAAETAYKAASLANMLAFLAGGKYRTVLERMAAARLVYVQPTMTRVISYEYLNRQLVWQEVAELLLAALPVLDALRGRVLLSALLPRLPNPRTLLRRATSALTLATVAAATKAATAQGSGAAAQEASEGGDRRSGSEQAANEGAQPPPPLAPPGPCPLCAAEDLTRPLCAEPCGHVYCYYCLASRCAADAQYKCPLDGTRVSAMRWWRPSEAKGGEGVRA